jgi:hypothetical protein
LESLEQGRELLEQHGVELLDGAAHGLDVLQGSARAGEPLQHPQALVPHQQP